MSVPPIRSEDTEIRFRETITRSPVRGALNDPAPTISITASSDITRPCPVCEERLPTVESCQTFQSSLCLPPANVDNCKTFCQPTRCEICKCPDTTWIWIVIVIMVIIFICLIVYIALYCGGESTSTTTVPTKPIELPSGPPVPVPE